MRIKIVAIFCLGVLGMVFTSFNGGVSQFSAGFVGTDVKIEWHIDDENGVSNYEISRKKPEENTYTRITAMPASGQAIYSFTDDKLYKADPNQVLSYRLYVKTSNGGYSYFANVAHQPTAVQRSWGSIKAMFK